MDYLKWIINWFERNGNAQELENSLDENYFEKGFIDSFAFIMLMAEIENEFGITFGNDKFQDRSFSTISGLAKALEMEVKNEN